MSCILCAWSKRSISCELWQQPPVESEQQGAEDRCVVGKGLGTAVGWWLCNIYLYHLFRLSFLLTANSSGGQKSGPWWTVILPFNRWRQSGQDASIDGGRAADLEPPSEKLGRQIEEMFRRGRLSGELGQVRLLLEPLWSEEKGFHRHKISRSTTFEHLIKTQMQCLFKLYEAVW